MWISLPRAQQSVNSFLGSPGDGLKMFFFPYKTPKKRESVNKKKKKV
jgi:hypothetical protein